MIALPMFSALALARAEALPTVAEGACLDHSTCCTFSDRGPFMYPHCRLQGSATSRVLWSLEC